MTNTYRQKNAPSKRGKSLGSRLEEAGQSSLARLRLLSVDQACCAAVVRAICEAGTSLVARPFTPANMASVNKAAKLNEVKEMLRVWVAVNMVHSGGLGVAMNEL